MFEESDILFAQKKKCDLRKSLYKAYNLSKIQLPIISQYFIYLSAFEIADLFHPIRMDFVENNCLNSRQTPCCQFCERHGVIHTYWRWGSEQTQIRVDTKSNDRNASVCVSPNQYGPVGVTHGEAVIHAFKSKNQNKVW